MHIETKYNIGDKVLVHDYYGRIVRGTVISLSVHIYTAGKMLITCKVGFDFDKDSGGEYDETSVYANI